MKIVSEHVPTRTPLSPTELQQRREALQARIEHRFRRAGDDPMMRELARVVFEYQAERLE